MTELEKLQGYLPSIYNDIDEIQKILVSEAIELENMNLDIVSVSNDVFMDNAEDAGLKRYENIFKLAVPIGSTLEERRSVVKSTLRGIDKLSGTVINNISLAYQNGDVDVNFVPSNIVVKFTSVIGIPTNIEKLKQYLSMRKPSHLGIIYEFRYLFIRDIDQVMTINQIQMTTLDKFAGGSV